MRNEKRFTYKHRVQAERGSSGRLLSLAFFLLHAHIWCSKNVTHKHMVKQTDKVNTEVPLNLGTNATAG